MPESIARVTGDDLVGVSEYSVTQEKEIVSGGKNPVKFALIGAVLGAVIAVGLIVVKEIFSEPVIYAARQFAELYPELPVLSDISAGDMGYSYAAAHLINIAADKDDKLVLGYADVKNSGVEALELSAALAAFGRKVLLVDAELYGRQISVKTGLDDKAGVSELVAEKAELSSLICKFENIDIIPAGKAADNAAAILADRKLAQIIESMKQTYDCVIFALPALGSVADAIPTVKHMDGAVLGLELNGCTVRECDKCVEQLLRTGTKLYGFELR